MIEKNHYSMFQRKFQFASKQDNNNNNNTSNRNNEKKNEKTLFIIIEMILFSKRVFDPKKTVLQLKQNLLRIVIKETHFLNFHSQLHWSLLSAFLTRAFNSKKSIFRIEITTHFKVSTFINQYLKPTSKFHQRRQHSHFSSKFSNKI